MTKQPLFFVVDDDSVTRLMLCRFLEQLGYATLGLNNGKEALAALDNGLPDIVLMDAKMPVMNGFETLAVMKSRPDTKNIPVLMITGLNDDASVDDAYGAGAADFIPKPIHWAILRNRVRYLLKDIEAERKINLASIVFDNTSEGIVVTNSEGIIQSVNPAFSIITGYFPEEVLGKSMNMVSSGRHNKAFYKKFWDSLMVSGRWQGEFWNRRKDGSVFPQWVTISAVNGADGKCTNYVGVFSDLSALKESEANLLYLSGHDTLTDLPNRHLFQERLALALTEAKECNGRVGVMLLDLDRFKVVNETLGHDKGDQLLVQVGKRLTKCLTQPATLGRMGGDEFGVILPRMKHSQDAARIAQEMLESLKKPFPIDGEEMEFFIGASIGIGLAPSDGEDVKTLLKSADAAMYHAKEQGRNNFQYYRDDLNTASMARMLMESSLRSALDKEEFVLYYQPQMDVATGKLVGAEALIRWQHSMQGLIAPGEFITLAEETGLIVPMGEWALRTACKQMKKWSKAGLPPIRVAVNLSGIQFKQPDFTDLVLKIIKETGIKHRWLELELTESIAMGDAEETFRKLNTLSEYDIPLAIDDFGTGFSSLSYLKRFPFGTLKIDRSFVRNCTTDAEDAALVRTIIGLANSLGLTVIAEGVEEQDHLEFLREHGCKEIQGYLYGRPMPAKDFATFIKNNPVMKDEN
ncbi:MAG: EAL domain-containing protein [Magnetococcales bacterium]|nr:EAL domain-containing protein [Magnetococcales bacterium]